MGIYTMFTETFFNEVLIAGSPYVTSFMLYFLNRILFLEKHEEKQAKRIKKFYIVYGIYTLAYFLIEFIIAVIIKYAANNADVPEIRNSPFMVWFLEFYMSVFSWIAVFMNVLSILLAAAILIYVCVTGRKRHRWLGIFAFPILFGYSQMINAVIDIPAYFIGGISDVWARVYKIAAYIAVLIAFGLLNSEKHAPAFMRRIDDEAQSRALSFKEEAGIWLIGIWLLIYSDTFPGISDAVESGITWVSVPVLIYLNVSNCVLCVVITAMIINGSYRRLYYEKNSKLQKSLISTMANLVESRDDNTGGHIKRTAKYVEIIARKLKSEGKFTDILTDRYIEDMIIAAPLHDVGKIHIPDSVLNKPGKLDDKEFSTMKTHSAAGGEIIERVEEEVGEVSYLSIAREMAEYHHERIDGRGYPHGISGDEIPVCARILAVADVFDALMSKRCYKEPMPFDTAIAIIKEESGTHFDTDIADAFINSSEEVREFLNSDKEQSVTA